MTDRAPTADEHTPVPPVLADDEISIDAHLSGESNESPVCTGQNNFPLVLSPPMPRIGSPSCTSEPQSDIYLNPSRTTSSKTCGETDTAHTSTVPNTPLVDISSLELLQTIPTPPGNHPSCEENPDSLDASDVPFSQEVDSAYDSEASSEASKAMSEGDIIVPDAELRDLCPSSYGPPTSESGDLLCEDLYSRLYYDYDEERYTRGHWPDVDEAEEHSLREVVSQEELESRANSQGNGGLSNWHYDSPFEEVTVQIDDVNENLEKRFLLEANTTLERVISDIKSRKEHFAQEDSCDSVTVTPLECLRSFVTDCLLEKLRYIANRALHQRRKKATNKEELLGLLILHVLCASYNESPTVVCSNAEAEYFYQMGISAERHHEVWSCLSGATVRRATHDYSSTGWCRSANRATTMITEIENEVAAINRDLVYVQNATVLSLDDDHLRMASRAVVELSYLRQHNNPKKGLGPVGNALCSALNPFFIACHFTRTGEKLLHTWERLVQLLQGCSTTGALRPMPDAIFAADRGYNSKETISFLSDVLGATLIGPHKRDLWYPYVFGDGPISKRHRGMNVSEKGCRAVYTARLKTGVESGSNARRAEACVYRESCSGRIAALVHNNRGLFPSRGFTIVCKELFRREAAVEALGTTLTLYDDTEQDKSARFVNGASSMHSGRTCVNQLLERVTLLTYYQSEDPVWFLLRAFRFTSRTAHGFVSAICRDYDARINGLTWALRGKTLRTGTEPLSSDISIARIRVEHRWEQVISALGMTMGAIPQRSSSASVAEQLTNASATRISSYNKNDLQGFLSVFNRGLESRANKTQLVAAVNQLKADILSGAVDLSTADNNDASTAAEQAESGANRMLHALREASLHAWVMKPLVATAGMREGSRNEVEILKALPRFFASNGGAYKQDMWSSSFSFDESFRVNVRYIRSTGLVESVDCNMLADSPDALLAATDNEDVTRICPVEVKTMTAVRTIESATALREKYGPVVRLEDVGREENTTNLFRELVPTTAYRAQVLHHAATLGLNLVLFVVGTGGSMMEGSVIYCCIVQFAETLRHSYTFVMDSVRLAGFDWVGKDPTQVPKEYDELLRNSHASDLYSFVSYYNLSQAIRAKLIRRGKPIPPTRMIRLTPAVYWNNLKGGVDVISRYLKTLARSNISENPVVSILARLLCMQVNNAAVVYRLFKAREAKVLPRTTEELRPYQRGYTILRHQVTQCESFGAFVRRLAKEWVGQSALESVSNTEDTGAGSQKLRPMFTRNAADRYNSGTHRARRLNKNIVHKKVSGAATYCVLCSWTLRGRKDGKTKIKRKGSRQVQWCATCRQAICSACWVEWHGKRNLKRVRPTTAETRAFEEALRPTRLRIL